jgi:anti-anti-sigma factor
VAQLSVAERGKARWILLEGELDQSDVLDLKGAFDAAVTGAAGDVVIDLGAVTFLGTLGIGLIASAQDRLEDDGRALRLANVPEFIDRTFRTMNLDEIFERA